MTKNADTLDDAIGCAFRETHQTFQHVAADETAGLSDTVHIHHHSSANAMQAKRENP